MAWKCDKLAFKEPNEEQFYEMELLSVAVFSFPVLYDNRHPEFYSKDAKAVAWEEVLKKLNKKNFLTGHDALTVSKMWNVLRDRYTRVKREYAEKCRSRTSTIAMRKGTEKVQAMAFMNWLDEFIKPRSTKKSIASGRKADLVETSVPLRDIECNDTEEQCNSKGQLTSGGNESNTLKTTDTLKKKRKATEQPSSKYQQMEQIDMRLLRSSTEATTAESQASSEYTKDEASIFGELVASKIRSLSTILEPDQLEDVQEDILRTLRQARRTGHHNRNASVSSTPIYLHTPDQAGYHIQPISHGATNLFHPSPQRSMVYVLNKNQRNKNDQSDHSGTEYD